MFELLMSRSFHLQTLAVTEVTAERELGGTSRPTGSHVVSNIVK